MKNLISIFALVIFGFQNAQAQCSDVANNFEMQLEQINNHQLSVKIKHTDINSNTTSILPTQKMMLDGLVFAIAWPLSNADVQIVSCESVTKPFAINIDEQQAGLSKKSKDHIVTFYQNTEMNNSFVTNWKNNVWIEIAIINFSGKLQAGEYFSFLNCEYGIANPNSYEGNSTTDPWLAMYDAQNNYLQYSPKMISKIANNMASNNSCKIYPIPTTGELHIDATLIENQNTIVKVVDMRGVLLLSSRIEMNKGSNKNVIDISTLPIGEYIIQVSDGKAWQYVETIIKK